MKKIGLFFTVLLIMLISSNAIGQVSVSMYNFKAVGLSTNSNKKFNFDFKMFTNIPWRFTNFELTGFYNFKARQYHRFSLGLGLNSAPFDDVFLKALVLPCDLEIYPLQDFKQMSVIFELTLYDDLDPDFMVFPDVLFFRTLLGLRYKFGSNNAE